VPERQPPYQADLRAVLIATLVGAIAFAAFVSTFGHSFVEWDDPAYVVDNPLVRGHDLGAMLRAVVSLNYHPLTMITLALNASEPLRAAPFLVTNAALHALNTTLVFAFALLLSGRRWAVASLVALLFGIHPMHVESVAWVSERKDVLYTFFFLAAAIVYLRYLQDGKRSWQMATFALFVCSCLSKGMAVVFPAVMMLLDAWTGRRWRWANLREKAPFILVGLLFGLIAIDVQAGGDFHGLLHRVETKRALAMPVGFTPYQHFALPTYGNMMYLVKLFLPIHLSAVYPYPRTDQADGPLYTLAPLVLVFMVALAFWCAPRARFVTFGIAWYLVTIAPVLQWIPVGLTIMADRYTYLSYFGLSFAVAMTIHRIAERSPGWRLAAWSAAGVWVLLLFAQTARQVEVWKNDGTLWSPVIRHHPGFAMAYANRGAYYIATEQSDRALSDLRLAASLGSRSSEVYENLGVAYGSLDKLDSALVMFDRAIAMSADRDSFFYNRAVAYLRLGRHQEALADADQGIALTRSPKPALQRARAHSLVALGRYAEGVEAFSSALAMGETLATTFYHRGVGRRRMGDLSRAAEDFREALRLDPGLSEARNQLDTLTLSNGAGSRRR
jgi:Tfp pilus assembly protein PilF